MKFTKLNMLLGGHQLPLALAWGQLITLDLGFSPGLKIKAWAKAQSREAIPIHALKHVAIDVLRAKCLDVNKINVNSDLFALNMNGLPGFFGKKAIHLQHFHRRVSRSKRRVYQSLSHLRRQRVLRGALNEH